MSNCARWMWALGGWCAGLWGDGSQAWGSPVLHDYLCGTALICLEIALLAACTGCRGAEHIGLRIRSVAMCSYVHMLASTMGLNCFGGVDAPLPSWPVEKFYLQPHKVKESCHLYPSPEILLQRLDGPHRANLSLALQSLSSSAYAAAANATFVLFLASPRSGHSLIGSLLDAHPNAMIANEADIFGVYARDPSHQTRSTLFNRLINNSLSCGIAGRFQTGYDYTVPGAYTGQWRCRIDVIGDKKGGNLQRRSCKI